MTIESLDFPHLNLTIKHQVFLSSLSISSGLAMFWFFHLSFHGANRLWRHISTFNTSRKCLTCPWARLTWDTGQQGKKGDSKNSTYVIRFLKAHLWSLHYLWSSHNSVTQPSDQRIKPFPSRISLLDFSFKIHAHTHFSPQMSVLELNVLMSPMPQT